MVAPLHPFAAGVIWYVTLSFATPELINTWLMAAAPGPGLAAYPETLAEPGVHVQVNNVPATFEVSATFVDPLLQISMVVGLFKRSGVG